MAAAIVDGLATIIAHPSTGDAVVFMATINRIADILKQQDHTHRPTETADGQETNGGSGGDGIDVRR